MKRHRSSSNSSEEEGNTNLPPQSGNPRKKQKKYQISPSKRWCWTYHFRGVPRDPYFLIKELEKKCDVIVIGYETGSSGEKPHLQGYVEFSTKLRPLSLGLYPDIHWEKAKGTREQNVRYCTKESLFYSKGIPTPPKDLFVEKGYIHDPKPWQTAILDIIKSEPDERTIHWFWERKGCIGKTIFAKHLILAHNALLVGGKASDAKMAIAQMTVKPKIVLLTIPRCVEHISYTALEEIKDGVFFSAKYESGMVVFDNPHVIIFANREPDKSKLSADRWNVVEIN